MGLTAGRAILDVQECPPHHFRRPRRHSHRPRAWVGTIVEFFPLPSSPLFNLSDLGHGEPFASCCGFAVNKNK